jgi:hypothetical protein
MNMGMLWERAEGKRTPIFGFLKNPKEAGNSASHQVFITGVMEYITTTYLRDY